MATALISALTQIPVRRDVAMTGEITLRGKVLPIGGLKEKAIAALRARVKKVIIPEANKKDLAEIPANVKRRLKFVPVTDVDEVLNEALTRSPFSEPKKPRSGKGRVARPARLPVV
jgi:ATP-dependent Lon protease